MRRDVLKLLENARGACAEVESFIVEKTLADLQIDVAFQRSVERSLAIVGEALRRLRELDSGCSDGIPHIRRIIGLRNVLAHAVL